MQERFIILPWYGMCRGIFLTVVFMTEDCKNMELLSPEEAANYLGLSVSYLYKLCKTGKIPHVNYGRHIIFRKADLYNWLNEPSVSRALIDDDG